MTFLPYGFRMLAELFFLSFFFRKTSDVDAAMTFLRSLYECRFLRYHKYFKENIQQKMSGNTILLRKFRGSVTIPFHFRSLPAKHGFY